MALVQDNGRAFKPDFYHSLILRVSSYCVIRYESQELQEPFEKFVDWRQCAAVMQREAVTVMPSCSGGGNVVMA
jgi:hypothetical protein